MFKLKTMSLYIAVFLLISSMLVACSSTKKDDRDKAIVSFTEVIKSDLLNVEKIDVQFADGNKMSITEPETIQDIISQIKRLRLREKNTKDVGYLYFLDLKEGDKTYRFENILTFDGKTYESIDDGIKKINDFIIQMGREKIPGLFQGVEDLQNND